jgi:hypothetical protein
MNLTWKSWNSRLLFFSSVSLENLLLNQNFRARPKTFCKSVKVHNISQKNMIKEMNKILLDFFYIFRMRERRERRRERRERRRERGGEKEREGGREYLQKHEKCEHGAQSFAS